MFGRETQVMVRIVNIILQRYITPLVVCKAMVKIFFKNHQKEFQLRQMFQ